MYQMTKNFENVVEYLTEFTKVEMSDDESDDSDTDDDKFTTTPTTSITFKHTASNHSETSTLKYHMINDSIFQVMTNPQTLICKFSDVVDEKMTENENNERGMIQAI
ncbi:predicted protein [Histoplasma capsulatum H143]|uniref:Uncharacterized protein n=1 Tax=Ajellomyces capsulatus (strain H143) TaxID=544712 RepID=C6HT09_AJECH|nr:predicted protein [Histoplasma capsulatum H143]